MPLVRFRIAFFALALAAVVAEHVGAQNVPPPASGAVSGSRSFSIGNITFDAFERERRAIAPQTPVARGLWPFSNLSRAMRRRGQDTAKTTFCPYPDGCGGTDRGGGIPAYGIALILAGAGGITYVLVSHSHPASPHPSMTSRDATPFPATTSRDATPFPATTSRDAQDALVSAKPTDGRERTDATPQPSDATGSPAVSQTAAPATTSGPGGSIGTTALPSIAPTEEPTTGPTPPQYTPTPTVSPSLIPCRTWQTEGYIEPVQGVWQDDPTFEDHAGAQITEVKPFTYEAELPMIAFRDTLLYGIDHYQKDGERKSGPGHFTIVIRGLSTCRNTKKLHYRFWVRDGAGSPVNLGEYASQAIPMQGPPLPNRATAEWTAFVPTEKGFPFTRTFKLSSPSGYHAWGELLDDHNDPTGFRADVFGKTNFTGFPDILVQPLMISTDTTDPKGLGNDAALLTSYGKFVAGQLTESGSDILPVKLGSVVASARPTTFLALKSHFSFTKQSEVVARLTSRLTALAALSKSGRIVAILRDDDFNEFNPLSFLEYVSKGKVVGIAIDAKVVLMREYSGWDTAYHELLHTMPYLWSSPQMKSECSRDYHNGADDGVANGVRIYVKGKLGNREWVDHKTEVLGVGDEGFFISQCTYAHLADALQHSTDPKTLFMRATIRQNAATTFDPFYTTDGFIDALATHGTWALIVRDAAGREVRRAAFTPNWEQPAVRVPRDAEEVSFRFPFDQRAASVEIRAHDRVVARRALTTNSPSVAIETPSDGATIGTRASINLRWHASDPTGAPTLAAVRVSYDAGKYYDVRAFETNASELNLPLDPKAHEVRINVLVTNGTASAEREVVVNR